MTSDVSTPSLDYEEMKAYWAKISTILGGTESMRGAREKYLSKLPSEDEVDYDFRVANAKFTNVFRDIVENLSAKPFSREIEVEGASGSLDDLITNIDGIGNHLHIFAADTFFKGLAYGLHWIFVDFTKTNGRLKTIAQEKAAGVRPHLVSICAEDLIAVETAKINGKYEFTHCRFKSNRMVREGYEQKTIERIYEYNRFQTVTIDDDGNPVETGVWGKPEFKIWERGLDSKRKFSWDVVEKGSISIQNIPLVPFLTGRRSGSGWTFDPMLLDAADLQIDLFRQEVALQHSETMSAFMMIAANGVTPPLDENDNPKQIQTGPSRILYSPMDDDGKFGTWSLLEPSASSMTFLASQVKETIQQLRELGRQPLTAQTGNLTTVTTQFAAQKGNSAIVAATFLLKDALENALGLMEEWMGNSNEPEVDIFSEFDMEINGSESFADILEMRKNGDLSQETLWQQAKRYRRLGSNFDPDEENRLITEEVPGDDDEEDIIDAAIPDQLDQLDQ